MAGEAHAVVVSVVLNEASANKSFVQQHCRFLY
jgi:hypothetical protein